MTRSKFEITENDWKAAVSNLAIATERGQEIARLQALLLQIVGKEWDRTTPVAGLTNAAQDEVDYVAEKNRALATRIDELQGAVHYLDKVCGILNLEHGARPVTYEEVPAIVESLMAHRDSAQERNEHLRRDVRELQKKIKERNAAANSLERSVTRMAKNTDALRTSARVVMNETMQAYAGDLPAEGTAMGRMYEALQCMENSDGVGS